jgi:hypothetical protein
MALTRITSGGIAEGVRITFDKTGTPTAPAISFNNTSDTGTGIYQSGTNELAIATDGQPRLIFKSDGRIVTGSGTILGGTNPDFVNADNITLYVNQSDLNASDVEGNDGGNINRPFKTIERALLEAARKSYKVNPASIPVNQIEINKSYTITSIGSTDFVALGATTNTVGVTFTANSPGTGTGTVTANNDKFEAFTIMVMPGQYEIDNRPGHDVTTNPLTSGTAGSIEDNAFRFNPRNGGVIVPRGTSIVGYDLRKTVIRPKYVPIPSTTTTTEEGSIVNDGYVLSHVMYDGATMIERNRGYIQEQTKLFLQNTNVAGYTGLSEAQKTLCVRDIGYFIDGIISDLREGGNENTFINAEYYIDGAGGYKNRFLKSNDTDLTAEVAATVSAFNRATLLMRYTVENVWSGYTEYTTAQGKTIDRTTFSAGNGYVSNGDCSTVSNAIIVLGGIATGILNNPNTYTTSNVTITLVGGTSSTVRLRKTPGVFKQTSIFKVTGGCYFWQMTFKDAVGTPYNSATFNSNGVPTFTTAPNPNYSHHRVVAFTYADQRTVDGELDQYYKKIDAWDATFDAGGSREVRPEEYTIVGDGSTNATIDTVNSCSPYIFNCSLRSVYGMCGMHTDGSKVAEKSFKSMVVAQFTGISLQRDTNAFNQPKDAEGDANNSTYNDNDPLTAAPPIYADPDAQYKPDWRHFHIKASNGGFIQVVSVFAVGYADQFLAESGGDMSITNSNSNFGQISLRAKGSQFNAFKPASQGKITALIPPRGINTKPTSVSFYNIDSTTTWEKAGQAGDEFSASKLSQYSSDADQLRLYLEGSYSSEADIPELEVKVPDYSQSPVNGVYPTITRRYLTYGTTNQYALFRDYYATSGTTAEASRYINVEVEEQDTEGSIAFSAKVYFVGNSGEVGSQSSQTAWQLSNSQRQGYFYDPNKGAVYLKLDGDDAKTKTFLSDFIFKYKTEEVFGFRETRDPETGATVTEFVKQDKDVLVYRDGFPSGLTINKNEDSRGSTPSDLLWRVEYTIPKDCPEIPKPPEKRFILKGIRPGNGLDGMPYTDYRFMIWDVEEYLTWERNVRDGVYYLTLIRADINKFVDGIDNAVDVVRRRPTAITNTSFYDCKFIEETNNYDKDTRLTTNVNYLYPSINEEGPTYDTRRTWNPPQSESRVIVEDIGAGTRLKDISVPNYIRYRAGTTPIKDVPAMYSVTAETVHRLVQAFDLRYTGATSKSSSNIAVASVVSWDDRASTSTYSTSSTFNVYGNNNTNRFGKDKSVGVTTNATQSIDYNAYGINGDALERRIVVCSGLYTGSVSDTTVNNYSISQAVSLYRPSILRASSHTWEYVGLGSGNYSTAFPQLQTRVLKPYEQYIAQGYENAGGFVASSGTNSNGDFYIGTQIIQAGGSSTVSLNVPKVRKSSESNFVDIENIENRIANSVVNVTASSSAGGKAQQAIKALSNFFNAEKLSVSNIATISNLVVQQKLFINNASINNAAFYPEGTTNAYGFVKAAKPEKTGFISTDTNDKLYVSPKYLDAWRVTRQLVSASAVTLDNNRVYIQPSSFALADSYDPTTSRYEAISLTDIESKIANNQEIRLYLKETSGLPSYGTIDIEMSLLKVDIIDYRMNLSSKQFLNPKLNLSLDYNEIDYTENYIVLNKIQNNFPIVDYIKSCIGTSGYNIIVRSISGFLDQGEFGINANEGDIKLLTARLSANVNADSLGSPNIADSLTYKNISITTTASEWAKWPDRGALSLRQYPRGTSASNYAISSFVYIKSTTQGTFTLIKKLGDSRGDSGFIYRSDYENNYPGIDSKNVFFAGCSTVVTFSDKWASEGPFIPPLDPTKGAVEDVNIEEATLFELPRKSIPIAADIDKDYIDSNLPNPFSSKALGVNIQTRTAVKKFAPLAFFNQVQQWCDTSGFNPSDEIELLMKPGYYKLDRSIFPCKIKINGSGLTKSSVFAGKEQTGISAGRMGGYLEDSIKRGDSIYMYRSPEFSDQWDKRDAIYVNISGGLTSKGGFNLNNVHFLGLNEAVSKNEIPDALYSEDTKIQSARRLLRKAYYTKNFIKKYFDTLTADGVSGALSFTANSTIGSADEKAEIEFTVNSGNVINSDISSVDYGELNPAVSTNSRYLVIRLKASNFAGSVSARRKFAWARKYIIPGSTMYWLNTGEKVSNVSESTKVLSVRRLNLSNSATWTSSSTEEIHLLVSVFRSGGANNGNSGIYTNDIEDLNIGTYSTGDKKLVFLNEDGAEFTTLVYNWALNRRRNFLPKGFMHEGGYQPAIIKRVTAAVTLGAGTAGVTIALDSVDLLKVGDRIVGAGIQPGTRIESISSGTKTIVTSDNISASLAVKTPLSFTQFDDFGDEIPKYDIPEVFGITRSTDDTYISIVIDRNPNASIDSSINMYPFGAGSFADYENALLQFKTSHTSVTTEYSAAEDCAVAIPRARSYSKRVSGYQDQRFVILDINPNSIADLSSINPSNPVNSSPARYIDNAGISVDILRDFALYNRNTISFGGGFGTGFTSSTVAFTSADDTTAEIKAKLDAAITNGGRKYNALAQVTLTAQSGATLGSGFRISPIINTAGGAGNVTGFTVSPISGQSIVAPTGNFTITITDRKGYILSPTGRTVDINSTRLDGEDFTAVAKANLFASIRVSGNGSVTLGSPYVEDYGLDSNGDIDTINARGKKIYCSWPSSYRALRRRFPSAPGTNISAVNGNYQSSLINVDAIPGSNFTLNLTNVTIGAQSPASESANTFGGGYRGGLIRCRGSKLTLAGTRFRGNLSLDWTGLLCERDSRAGGLFIAGHSIEMFQMEDQNSFDRIGGSSPAQRITTSKEDEEFYKITEFDPLSNVYLEPAKDPYGQLSDGDPRTFEISTFQAIRRQNLGSRVLTAFDGSSVQPGELQTKISLFERYQSPYGIYYDNTTTTDPDLITEDTNGNQYLALSGGTRATAVRLRWNNTTTTIQRNAVTDNTTVTSGTLANLPGRTLTFLYPDTESGQDLINNIFFGANATRIVKPTNIQTTYATVTRLQTYAETKFTKDGVPSSTGKYRIAVITYSGTIPAEVTAANGSFIQFNTKYLNSQRYNYISTITSRYQKTVLNGASKLILSNDGGVPTYASHADLDIEDDVMTPQLSRSTILTLKNITQTTGVTDGMVRMSTNSSGRITSLDIITYGTGHKEGDNFAIYNGVTLLSSGLTIKARRNLSDIDISILDEGEYMAILPKNCFVVNSINLPSPSSIKQKLIEARLIFTPGSYIFYANNYYRIGNTDLTNKKPYIGVYKYVNPINLSDQRADIVVMLEDPEYAPTYAANTRFDLFKYDNILNYWPDSGRLVIGNRETCEFTKVGDPTTNTGYQLQLTRSMTKYWPHYIRDWEGLDPNDSTDATVTFNTLNPTVLRLSGPVDVTCYGIKRILPSDNTTTQTFDSQTVAEYVCPSGMVSNKVARVSIPAENLDADFQKLSIGQIITIPYKDIADTYNWSGCRITVGDAQYNAGSSNSTNRAGDRVISGTIRSTTTFNTRSDRTFNIFGTSTTNIAPYEFINPMTMGRMSSPRGDTFSVGPAGFGSYNYMWTPLHETALSGSTSVKISAAFIRSIRRLNTDGQYTATIESINSTTDPTERMMTVTAVASGGLFKGQPIRTGSPSGPIIGYVVGFEGDFINDAGTYEDNITLTGNGNTGVYRIQIVDGQTIPTTSTTFYGTRLSGGLDYLVWARNNGGWSRTVTSVTVDPVTKIATINLNAGLATPSGGTTGTTPSINAGDWVLWYFYGTSDNNIRLLLDKPLMKNIPEGTVLSICPTNDLRDGTFGEAGIRATNGFIFKSRIIDIEKSTNKLNLYLADDFPQEKWSNSVSRSYGLLYVNHGGWTYPKTGGSSFRANNAVLTAPDGTGIGTTIKLPNRSGRIQAGDTLSYTWEDELVVESTAHAGGTITSLTTQNFITTLNDQRYYIFPGYLIYDSGNNLIGTVSSVAADRINLTANCLVATTSLSGWKFTSTGRIVTYSSQITGITSSLDSNGYATITINGSLNQILHTSFPNKKLWLSIDDIFVSHREGNFTFDGPVARKFIYTDTGVKLTFGDYRMWYERYQNYIRAGVEAGGQEISGRQGWVGNFGLSTSGQRTIGLVMNGASSVQWGRQYNNSMWLAAVPIHAKWESIGYSNYMVSINDSSTIENNYALSTLTSYDGDGRFKFNALNHTSLGTGSIYAGQNTGDYNSGGGESYDTKQYQFASSIRLKYSLQDGTVSSSGTVAGGSVSRLAEQYIVNRIIHYKPSLDVTVSRISQTLPISITTNTATLSGTNIGNILLPGDVVYSEPTPSASNRIGTVMEVASDNNSVTLSKEYTGTTITGDTSWSYISPRVKHSGTSNAPSNALVFSGGGDTGTTDINDIGTRGFNVSATSAPGYNRYNFRFNINRRTFNQTVLLNTYDQFLPTRTIADASKVIDISIGDLPVYRSPLMNVEVTRLNSKTHIEQSISVVGSQANI